MQYGEQHESAGIWRAYGRVEMPAWKFAASRVRVAGIVTTKVGKWTSWYQGTEQPWPYGDTTSYEIGAAWLADCARVGVWRRLAEHFDPSRAMSWD
jgi:hypothetical protein